MSEYKYVVSKIMLPEYETGSLESVEPFYCLDNAMTKCDELNELNEHEEDVCFKVIVDIDED